MAEKKVKDLFQFRATSTDFVSAEEHEAFLKFVEKLSKTRKTSDFFRNAVLEAFRLEQKATEEKEMHEKLKRYINEVGIEEALRNITNAETFGSVVKDVNEEEKESYHFLLQYARRIGVEEVISRVDDAKRTEVKVDMDKIVQNVLDALKQQGVDIKEEQQKEVKQTLQVATKSDLDLLDGME
ncbi:hypothetical protein [Bacillus paramycoides]|uniref:hypothetical protein n=1 Tax=Bacillus paramycoides TaxID=2026194 RepID=UPI002E1B0AEE|nr:hypothetical protein [Bacillus paramycoides]